jgi:hypothetical protein
MKTSKIKGKLKTIQDKLSIKRTDDEPSVRKDPYTIWKKALAKSPSRPTSARWKNSNVSQISTRSIAKLEQTHRKLEGIFEIDSKENTHYWFSKNTDRRPAKHDHTSSLKSWNFAGGDVEGPKLGFNNDLKNWIAVNDGTKHLPVQRGVPPENFSINNFRRYKTSLLLNPRPSGDARFENAVSNYYHPESYFAHRLNSKSKMCTEVKPDGSENLKTIDLVDNPNATSNDAGYQPFVKKNFLNETSHIFNRNSFSLKEKYRQTDSWINVSKEESFVNFDIRQENCNHIGGHDQRTNSVFEKKIGVLQKRNAVNDESENLIPAIKPMVVTKGNSDYTRTYRDGLGTGINPNETLHTLFKNQEVCGMKKFVSLSILEDSEPRGQGLSREDSNTQYHQNHTFRPNYTTRRISLRRSDSGGALVGVGDNYRDPFKNTSGGSNLIALKGSLAGEKGLRETGMHNYHMPNTGDREM